VRTLLLTLAVLTVPRLALACPVCFGESDAPLAQAMKMGVYAMLVVVVGVLGSFASFIVYLIRRARAFEASAVRQQSDSQEETVRC
jgi:hypothetical protein